MSTIDLNYLPQPYSHISYYDSITEWSLSSRLKFIKKILNHQYEIFIKKYYNSIILSNIINLKDKYSKNYIHYLHYLHIVQGFVKYVRILRYVLLLFFI